MSTYDVVIVGGGVAGCVLAARLSEDPGRTVCLVEAGPDYGPDVRAWPEALRDARVLPRGDVWERHVPMHRVRAKVLGGSSCVNGCWHTWPSAADHREWTELAGPQWSAEALEPYRRRAIAQMELIPPPGTELSAFARAAVEAARALGFAEVDMATTGSAPGYGVPLLNSIDGVRWNAAFAYLTDARTRPNLTILGDSPVRQLTVHNGRVRGVVVDGRAEPITGGTYVLAAGALGSPAILLRSGIGPAGHLKEVGIETEIDLPGVGANLSDQPGVFLPLAPTPELNAALAAQQAAGDLYVSRVLARAATAGAPADGWDLHVLPVAGPPLFGKLPPGEYEAGISAYLMKPASRGHVRLNSADPADPLDLDPAVLSDPDGLDLARMRSGLRLVERFADEPAVARWTRRVPGPSPADLPDEELRRRASVYWHPVGTCAAGPDADPDAVVDAEGRVRGTANLRVADASILPTLPAANTQLPVLALAEQLADRYRRTL